MCDKLHISQVYPTPLLLCFDDSLSVTQWFVAFEFENVFDTDHENIFEYKNTNNLQRILKVQHADNYRETIMSPCIIAQTEVKVWNKVKPTFRLNQYTQIAKLLRPRSGQHHIRSFGPHIRWNDGADVVGLNQINQNLPKSGPQLILFQWARSLLVYLVRPWLTSRSGLPKCHHSTQYVGCLRESVKLYYLGTHFGLLWLFERSCRREEDTSINRFFLCVRF